MTPTETNTLLAESCGWSYSKGAGKYWVDPYGNIQPELPDYTTDYNLFILCWNKAVDELSAAFRWREAKDFFVRLDCLQWKFTIENRLPILIEIITLLNQQKK